MSIHSKHKERQFQIEIVAHLLNNGWIEGDSKAYDKELGLYRSDLLEYIKTTQPTPYLKMQNREGAKTDEVLCRHIAKEMDRHGSLHYLRHEIKYIGSKFKLCQFRPELYNAETQKRYDANILRVVQEVTTLNGKARIDLVLFLNGVPLVTLELKTDFTQTVQDAIEQYKKDRLPKSDILFAFKKRVLVHFAVSNDEVYMTSKLAGRQTHFLPFNKGKEDASAGNPHNPNGYATSYLWEEVLQRDSLLNIIAKYVHLESKDAEDHQGIKSTKETLIFPRYHQLDVVRKLLSETKTHGVGQNYLIQHSAGSGKSNSIAWLAHQLSSLHNDKGVGIIDSVIVITDRTVLDNQLQETISSFEHKEGLVVGISREGSSQSKSQQLAKALDKKAKIIITTIQTFPFVLDAIKKRPSFRDNSYAIIADEAHSSQTGSSAIKLKEVLKSQEIEENTDITAEDVITSIIETGTTQNLSFYAFTATPKPKTLETFGVRPNPSLPPSDTNIPRAFHHYSMRQAIEEGFILDVLKGYVTYKLYYKLEHSDPKSDEKLESKKAKIKISKTIGLHPTNIGAKVEIIYEHFMRYISHLLDNQAKAMVVTSSRNSAVRYKIAFDKYIEERGMQEKIQTMVAFSGKVIYEEREYTELTLNPNLKGREMRKAFDSNDYQVMLVANKFQTGFDQPKLCAMYVDKKLGGVDCVQTLSRLNRIYDGKEQTFILDFVNSIEEIKEAFEPYYLQTEIDDVTDPNIIHELENKLNSSDILISSEIDQYAQAFFDPKGTTQALMSSAVKPAVDRYKNRYALTLKEINEVKNIKENRNYESELKKANQAKNALDIFKKDLVTFVRLYGFLSQIVDYADEELLKLYLFTKALIPNLKTSNTNDPIDISAVKLIHYKLDKEEEIDISLNGEESKLKAISGAGGAVPKDPSKEFLSQIIKQMNALFGDEFSDRDDINYLKSLLGKVMENPKVKEQITNNTKEQAMMGGFKDIVGDAVIDSIQTHEKMTMKVLNEEHIKEGVTDIVYALASEEIDGGCFF